MAEQEPSAESPPQSQTDSSISPTQTRRPRGRPKGSKNIKPQTPEPMRTHILQVTSGNDVVECISAYVRRWGRALALLSATGAVANATVLQPGPGGGVVTLQGCSMIMSLSGTVFSPPWSVDLSILVSAGNGQVFGGRVVRPLVAAGLLVLTAMSFERLEYIRLPLKEEEDPTAASSSQSSSPVITGGGGGHNLASGECR